MSNNCFDPILSGNDGPRECKYKTLLVWNQECGIYSKQMGDFLQAVVQEMNGSIDSLPPDRKKFLKKASSRYYENRRIAVFLYDCFSLYTSDDFWFRRIRENFCVEDGFVATCKSDYPNSSIEARYRILGRWMDKHTITRLFDIVESLKQ